MSEKRRSEGVEEVPLLCPLCGRELADDMKVENGWECTKCGEFIPSSMVIDPFEGCTHGRNCNCGRERRK